MSPLRKTYGEIQTDEIIITNERIEHIKARHKEDYDFFLKYLIPTISQPDLIIKDCRNNGTIFMVKKLPDINISVIVRIALNTDKAGLKNSVMTFYRLRDKNLEKLIEKNELLYKRE